LDILNARFAHGMPSSSVAENGVLVRQFENDWFHTLSPWRACAVNVKWCEDVSDRLATSFINAQARQLYYDPSKGGAGVIVSPDVGIFCAYPEDGNSLSKKCEPLGGDGRTCIPGCSPAGEQCQEVGRDYSCSFGRDFLLQALEAQQRRESYRSRNNEIVVSMTSMLQGLPRSIEAFFYLPHASSNEIRAVQRAQQELIETYHLSRHDAPPILVLDLVSQANTLAPFSIAPEVRF
jgi:hypothetical protein